MKLMLSTPFVVCIRTVEKFARHTTGVTTNNKLQIVVLELMYATCNLTLPSHACTMMHSVHISYRIVAMAQGTLQDSEEILVPYFEKMQKKWPKIWYSFIILMKYRTHLLIHLYI